MLDMFKINQKVNEVLGREVRIKDLQKGASIITGAYSAISGLLAVRYIKKAKKADTKLKKVVYTTWAVSNAVSSVASAVDATKNTRLYLGSKECDDFLKNSLNDFILNGELKKEVSSISTLLSLNNPTNVEVMDYCESHNRENYQLQGFFLHDISNKMHLIRINIEFMGELTRKYGSTRKAIRFILAHELRHQWQYEHKNEEYTKCSNPSTYRATYSVNPIEVDANNFADMYISNSVSNITNFLVTDSEYKEYRKVLSR